MENQRDQQAIRKHATLLSNLAWFVNTTLSFISGLFITDPRWAIGIFVASEAFDLIAKFFVVAFLYVKFKCISASEFSSLASIKSFFGHIPFAAAMSYCMLGAGVAIVSLWVIAVHDFSWTLVWNVDSHLLFRRIIRPFPSYYRYLRRCKGLPRKKVCTKVHGNADKTVGHHGRWIHRQGGHRFLVHVWNRSILVLLYDLIPLELDCVWDFKRFVGSVG